MRHPEKRISFLCVTAIYDLRIKEKLGRGDRITENVFITNDTRRVLNKIDSQNKPMIGLLEWAYLEKADVLIYSISDSQEGQNLKETLFEFLIEVSAFLTTLWVFEDNNANNELGFVIREDPPQVDSNFHTAKYTKADGTSSVLSLTRKQLREVRKIHRTMVSEDASDRARPTKLYKGTTRLSRAYYLLQSARIANDLGIKISSYCTAFEALLSSSPSELAHQLSERAAFFLGDASQRRRDIYDSMKTAYGVRSLIVHGSALKPQTMEKLPEISKGIDRLLRECVRRILDDPKIFEIFKSDSSKFEDYMLSRIFGAETGK